MNEKVNDNPAESRFELVIEGHLAAAYYKKSGNVITFEHTEVPAELGGKGVGSRLVQGALEQVRAPGSRSWQNVPSSKPGSVSMLPMPICSRPEERNAMPEVRDNKALGRFELDVEGAVAFANYRLTPQAVVITQPRRRGRLRGRGIASELVKGALELIRADGHKVVAGCDSSSTICTSTRSLPT